MKLQSLFLISIALLFWVGTDATSLGGATSSWARFLKKASTGSSSNSTTTTDTKKSENATEATTNSTDTADTDAADADNSDDDEPQLDDLFIPFYPNTTENATSSANATKSFIFPKESEQSALWIAFAGGLFLVVSCVLCFMTYQRSKRAGYNEVPSGISLVV